MKCLSVHQPWADLIVDRGRPEDSLLGYKISRETTDTCWIKGGNSGVYPVGAYAGN